MRVFLRIKELPEACQPGHLRDEAGAEVVNVDKLTYAGNLDSLAPVARDRRFAFVKADIVDGARMRELLGVCPDVTIASDCIIGAGSVVHRDIILPGTYIGVPAVRVVSQQGETHERRCGP